MTEVDEAERVLQSDGKSHWVDQQDIRQHHATDFSDTKFKRKSEWGVGITVKRCKMGADI